MQQCETNGNGGPPLVRNGIAMFLRFLLTERLRWLAAACCLACTVHVQAATFSGGASISANDPTGALSADTVNNALTVSCWFRLSIPSSTNLTENLVILMDRTDGNEAATFSYEIRFNIFNGNLEFLANGATGTITNKLIDRPYLDRWYHVAVVRQQSAFTAYIDGRQLASFPSVSIGNAAGGGLSIGGISGNSRLFLGDIVEVAIYQTPLSQNVIQDRMFKDQRASANLKGYYKLAYSTNAADFYRNYVPTPPAGTDPAAKQGAGTIGFEETDQAGEQSIFDSRKNRGQDALTPLSGAFSWSQTALARPVPGLAFEFRFGYSSATPTTAPADGSTDPLEPRVLGKNWRQTFDTRIAPDQNSTERRLVQWDGSIETWNRTNSAYFTRHREYRGELIVTNSDFEWTTPERLVYHFQDPTDGSLMAGRLREIRDFNGNKVQIQWNEGEGYITNVIDTVGASYQFNYNTALGLLTNLTFGQWQVNFAYDATNRLVSKTLTNTSSLYPTTNATTWQFQYDTNGLLARIVDPRANTSVLVQYDQYGRQTNQVDALGRAAATRYGVPGNRQITRIDSGTNSWLETYDRKGHVLAQQDPLTNITEFAYNTNGNRISTTEPLGWTTTLGYDNRANAIATTNALGEVTRWAFHPFFNKAIQEINPLNWTNFYAYDNGGNLTNHSDDLGSLVRYTYATNGLVLTATDGNGNLSRFAYDTNGFLLTQTDPATNTTTFTRNDVGWKLAELDALGRRTAYTFDLNGNVVLTVDPIFREFSKTYDANGNLLTASDAKGNVTRFSYDAANQKTNLVDRTGTNLWQYTYTSRGKLALATDPQANTVTQTYDPANRLVSITDPLGGSLTNLYDANGNQTVLIDKVGQRWMKTFDRLNRVIAELSPLGDTRQTAYDEVGRIKVLTTPRGYPSTHTYDGRGRLIKWVDAENFPWLYAYDGNANITNITDALTGHYLMTYGPRNERLTELNQDTKQWTYAYDELLRLKQQTDPNGTTRNLHYDAGSRPRFVSFNTGRTNSFTYDLNNNPLTITRSLPGSSPVSFILQYDILDRVTNQFDSVTFQPVQYGFDSLGRMTTLVYPYGKTLLQRFDALGRLTNQVDWAGRQLNYAYDKADRIIFRSYPNGVVQNNAFDNASRITNLEFQSATTNVQMALSYAYDRNGNKIGSTERGTLDWPMPSLTDERSRFTPAGKLIDRQIQNNSVITNQQSAINYQYDASGNMTNARGAGQTWALTYDEDNRVLTVNWDAVITAKNISNKYDSLGRRVSRMIDGSETKYVLSLAGSMERILCDLNPDGTVHFYVHGPDLCYKVDSSNNLLCYHADAMANIIALTDGNTNLVAQYAYTPYGRTLGSTNLQSQIANPYLFVGSQGVMEELPGLYFMRARYYLADAGVFLSTDPVKNIGPGWNSVTFDYAQDNPLKYTDPNGQNTWLAAFALGWFKGSLEGLAESAAEDLIVASGMGNERGKQNAELAFQLKSFTHTIHTGGQLIESRASVGGVGVAFYIGDQVANYTTDPILKLSKFLTTSVGNAGAAIGDKLHAAIFGQGQSTTVNSSMAGTPPMAILKAAPTSSANQAVSGSTAAVAAPKATGMTAVTSTKPSGASGGGTTSGGGGGPTSYTVKAGDTLGHIAYANHTTVSAIAAASGIKNVNLIHPGQVVRIRP